jgi:hypothetical protein
MIMISESGNRGSKAHRWVGPGRGEPLHALRLTGRKEGRGAAFQVDVTAVGLCIVDPNLNAVRHLSATSGTGACSQSFLNPGAECRDQTRSLREGEN